jgi:3-dehydroquinate dehydratase-2
MTIWIINGPNLNMLGIREPGIYGKGTYEDLCRYIRDEAEKLGVETEIFQSNHEGEIVTKIQEALGRADAIVINPAAYTHTSIAILDALKAVNLPAAEVHLSDVTKRESFRQISYAGMACREHFIGLGFEGYARALKAMKNAVENALFSQK